MAASVRIIAPLVPRRSRRAFGESTSSETMTTTTLQRISGGLLVLLGFTSLVLLYVTTKPHGIDGVAYANLLNAGKIPEIRGLVSSAERHARLLPYWQLSLWGTLVLIAILSVFSFRQSSSGRLT